MHQDKQDFLIHGSNITAGLSVSCCWVQQPWGLSGSEDRLIIGIKVWIVNTYNKGGTQHGCWFCWWTARSCGMWAGMRAGCPCGCRQHPSASQMAMLIARGFLPENRSTHQPVTARKSRACFKSSPLDYCPVLSAGCSSHPMGGREALVPFLPPFFRWAHAHTDRLRSRCPAMPAPGSLGAGARRLCHGSQLPP